MKEKIIAKINGVRSELDNAIYELRDKYDYGDLNYYWDILNFINWVKENHPEETDDDGWYDLDATYREIEEFGYTYMQLFPRAGGYILYEDGILGIDIPIEKMIETFYNLVIGMSEQELVTMREQLVERIKNEDAQKAKDVAIIDQQKMWEIFEKKLTDVHGALFQKEKDKKDNKEINDAGMMARFIQRTKK